jgi:energy-coupling factor transporter ATP-binding protein EcfA2
MAFHLRLSRFTVSDGSSVPVPPGAVVVVVGPNNSGKSRLLRDIYGILAQNDYHPKVVTSADVETTGREADLRTWLAVNTSATQGSGSLNTYSRMGQSAPDLVIRGWAPGKATNEFGNLHISYLGPAQSLGIVGPCATFAPYQEAPSHPLHYVYLDPELEQRIAAIAAQAFDIGVVLDRFAGKQILLRLGDPPTYEPNAMPGPEYFKALRSLPTLHEQGDGFRSYLGLLLHLIAVPYFLRLMDEPEVFLHPPQANHLGKALMQLKPADSQIVLATHDANLLRGLLDDDTSSVMILRLTRNGHMNPCAVLAAEQVRVLWTDPILRYSNVLEGLFHNAVILCEGDADCRFYASVMDCLPAARRRSPDVLFTHCGGKHRMPAVVKALNAVSVPVAAAIDFDILNDQQPLRKLVELKGGDWRHIEPMWRIVKKAIDAEDRRPQRDYVKKKLSEIIDRSSDLTLTDSEVSLLRQSMRGESAWERVKRGGIADVPQGEAYIACERLLSALSSLGLFVVPVGELERFVPQVGSKGPAWVTAVHEQHLHEAAANAAAGAFVSQLLEFSVGATEGT